jgi:hypothetical protein
MNIEVHIFRTRDGQWKARISYSGKVEYIDKCPNMGILMEQVTRALLTTGRDN